MAKGDPQQYNTFNCSKHTIAATTIGTPLLDDTWRAPLFGLPQEEAQGTREHHIRTIAYPYPDMLSGSSTKERLNQSSILVESVRPLDSYVDHWDARHQHWRRLWEPFWRSISGAQGPFARACPHTTCAVGDVETNFRPLALRAVGHGHSRTLPAAVAQKKFLLVATDYFSKWVEAEAYASIKDKDVTKFVWKNIICHFGIPQTIIADDGPQFDSKTFRNFCSELNIRNSFSTPRYPQSNGQAEATNKTLITALKKRLEQAKGKWVEELPGVLWAYRTTPGRLTGNTPFALAYGRNLDWADEVRETASIRMADYQQRAAALYNRKARPRSFKSGTLVLRKVFENTAETGPGKFQANWEDPYIVSKTSESGAYHLQKLDGTPLLRPWNVSNLKQYYQ
ncbi:Gag-Pol polyprotein [Vitis vinifera]|uniref:Gag-Pol polyprotein n=1 Tax=Vitis vinifera TaxID=29760 RepID=A0A438KLP9_VITVI|nr:Gag-Pol polyprotein [Vitis vinifera]